MHQPGKMTNRTVLNVFGPMGRGGRYILDSLNTGSIHTDYYHNSDLINGAVINVYGRRFFIYGCDEFTQEYYKFKYGIGEFNFTTVSMHKVVGENLLILNRRAFGNSSCFYN